MACLEGPFPNCLKLVVSQCCLFIGSSCILNHLTINRLHLQHIFFSIFPDPCIMSEQITATSAEVIPNGGFSKKIPPKSPQFRLRTSYSFGQMIYMMYLMEVHKAIIHLCLALLRLGRMIVAVFVSECWVKPCTRSYQDIF